MLVLKKTLFLFFLILLVSFVPHRYYFSLTEIRIDTQKKTFNVSCKLFTDDLEDALYRLYQQKVDVASSTKSKKVNDLLYKYMNEHLKLVVNDKALKYEFIGFEKEDNSTWCYLELDYSTKSIKKIEVTNSILYDFLPDQNNIIQVYVNKETKSERLQNPTTKAIFEL